MHYDRFFDESALVLISFVMPGRVSSDTSTFKNSYRRMIPTFTDQDQMVASSSLAPPTTSIFVPS
jgi:hypothetical protein